MGFNLGGTLKGALGGAITGAAIGGPWGALAGGVAGGAIGSQTSDGKGKPGQPGGPVDPNLLARLREMDSQYSSRPAYMISEANNQAPVLVPFALGGAAPAAPAPSNARDLAIQRLAEAQRSGQVRGFGYGITGVAPPPGTIGSTGPRYSAQQGNLNVGPQGSSGYGLLDQLRKRGVAV